MACFIVIHAKNEDERLQITSNFDKNLKYKVIPDMNDYIAKSCKVSEEEVVRTVQNDQVIAKQASSSNNFIPPSIDTSRDATPWSSESTQGTGVESVGVDRNLVRRTMKSNPTTIDTIGHDESYGTNFYDMTLDSSMEEYTYDGSDLSFDDALIPSTSYQQSMRNDMDESDTSSVDNSQALDTPPGRKSGKRPRCSSPQKQSRQENSGIICMYCLKPLNQRFKKPSKAIEHAITHTDIDRYECPVEKCNYKSGTSVNVYCHFKSEHAGIRLKPRKIELTTEQKEELDDMFKKCFILGEIPKQKPKTCIFCYASFANPTRDKVERHALTHIGFMLYQCYIPKCDFKSVRIGEMTKHGRRDHGIWKMSKEETAIELTAEQKQEIVDMMERCFPDEEE